MAYARSPNNMKGMVMAMFLLTNAVSALLSIILTGLITDPTLIWAWAGPAIALFVQTAIFWWRHRGLNDDEFMTVEEDEEDRLAGHTGSKYVDKSSETDSQELTSEKKL